jgi:hypothetical protein
MRRIFIATVASLGLAGCSGTLFPGAGTMEIALQSAPPGADATTSLGPGCKTPCTVAVPSPTDDFSVSFMLNGFEPMTIPVHITRSAGSLMTPPMTSLNPSPVVAQLQPIAPPPKATRTRPKKKPPAAQ